MKNKIAAEHLHSEAKDTCVHNCVDYEQEGPSLLQYYFPTTEPPESCVPSLVSAQDVVRT